MVNKIVDSSTLIYDNYSSTYELNNQTEELLNKIVETGDWALDGGKHLQVRAIQIGVSGGGLLGMVSLMNLTLPVIDYLNPLLGYHDPARPFPFSLAVGATGISMLQTLASVGERKRVTQLSNKLNELAVEYKKVANCVSVNIAENLETAAKVANAYTTSRSYREYCLAATLLATGFAGSPYSPIAPSIAFAVGLAGTAALSLYTHTYKRQDLQQVSENITQCLERLKLQRQLVA